jgi:tight adherence protein B
VRRFRGLAVVAAALVVVPSALAGVRIAGTDASGYPRLVVNVVTSQPVAKAPRLTEDGAPIAPFAAVNLGKTKDVVLAIDNSQSMKGSALRNATAAARAFVAAKSHGDRISVVSFGRHVIQLTSFSGAGSQAAGALGGLKVDTTQGTSLYDAIVAAAKALHASDRPGRVIIVLTDGKDVSSVTSLDEAVAAARRANASVYPIGIESRDFDPAPLRSVARETGGTYHGAGSSAELQQVYASIASELDRTWRIGYDTAARPGDHVLVRAAASGAGTDTHPIVIPAGLGGDVEPNGGPLPAVAYTPLGTLVVSLLVGLLVLFAVFTLVRLRRGSWVQQRLAPHVYEKRKHGRGQNERLSVLKALFRATDSALGRRSQWESIRRLLVRGDVPLRPAEFVWLCAGCGLAGAFILAVGGAPAIMVLIGIGLGGSLPYIFVSLRVRKRSKAFENQLPDLLTTIAASLKAGHSFKHGLQAVVDESQPPASVELRRVLTEAGLGRPLDDALTDMADRVASENFAFAITAVTIQRQVGGSLAALFDMVSETVRNRQQFARKIRSLTAMGRMSAYTLIGIPFFITGMISLTNAGYMSPLFHTHLGHLLMFLGLGMMAVGSMLLKKIVSFKG